MLNIKFKDGIVEADSFPVNEAIAGIVPMALPNQLKVLLKSIKIEGQQQPVLLYHGEICDGRCRLVVCKQLGIKIKAKEFEDNILVEDVKRFIKTTHSRRDLTDTQKFLIAARESILNNKLSVRKAAERWGVGYATVYNAIWLWENYKDVAQELFDGKSVPIKDINGNAKASRTVHPVYRYYKTLLEVVIDTLTDEDSIGFTDDAFIKTQLGKNWYKEFTEKENIININIRRELAILANFRFKLIDGTEVEIILKTPITLITEGDYNE